MSDILDEAQELFQCKTCSWYRNCILPMRMTEDDLKKQIEASIPGASASGAPQGMSELLSGMVTAAQNTLLEGCPIFISRLRKNPELAQRIKKIMQEWSKLTEE